MTKEELYNEVKEWQKSYPSFRDGQAVFNYVDSKYGIAREIQFIDHIDCFYDNSEIDRFLTKAIERINDLNKSHN